MLAGARQFVEQDVAAAVRADEVGIDHPDHVDPLGGEPLHVPADFWKVDCAHRCLLGRTSGTSGTGVREAGGVGSAAGARGTGGHPGLVV
ncbi:hypothetical protein GCM10009540_41280 [Streptomyces turgidiscabies]